MTSGTLQRLLNRLLAVPQLKDLLIAQAIPLGIAGALNFLTAALLGPAGRGKAAFLIMGAGLGSSVLFGSLHAGAVHEIRSKNESGAMQGLLIAGTLSLIPFTLAILVLLSGSQVGPDFLRPIDTALLLGGLGIATIALYVLRTLQGLGLSASFRHLMMLQTGTYAAITVGAVAFGLTPTWVMVGWVTGQAISLAEGLRHLFRETKVTFPRHPIGSLLRSSLAAHVGGIGNQIMYRADLVLLGLIATVREVGVYAVATAVAELIWLMAEAFSLATFAEGRSSISNLERGERLRDNESLFKKLALPAAAALGAFGFLLFNFLLDGYKDSFPVLLVLLPGVVMGGIGRMRLSATIAADQRRTSWVSGGIAILGSLLYLPLIGIAGALGAAVASSILYSVQAVFMGWLLRRASATVVR